MMPFICQTIYFSAFLKREYPDHVKTLNYSLLNQKKKRWKLKAFYLVF